MKQISKEDRAGIYLTVILHLAVLIIMLIGGLGYSLKGENSFVLDFSKLEEMEKMQQEVERLQKEAELKQAIADKLQKELGDIPAIRNVAVNRSALKDDRGTDAEKLYKDAEKLQNELENGYEMEKDEIAAVSKEKEAKKKEEKKAEYSGPSVISYMLEGRKASKLPIPAYRCMGAGRVTVLVVVDPAGNVLTAKVDETVSSSDGCLRSFAIRAARMSKFSANAQAVPRQNGNIVYEFIAQ